MKNDLLKADELTRRSFVLNAAKTCLGVSVLNALAPSAHAAPFDTASKARQLGTAKNVIYLYMSGGMTHLDTFGCVPGAETMGDTKPIANVGGWRSDRRPPAQHREGDAPRCGHQLADQHAGRTRPGQLFPAHRLHHARRDPPPHHGRVAAEVPGQGQLRSARQRHRHERQQASRRRFLRSRLPAADREQSRRLACKTAGARRCSPRPSSTIVSISPRSSIRASRLPMTTRTSRHTAMCIVTP